LSKFQKEIEKNILQLFKTFKKDAAFFLSERDVQSYLYHLLLNDPLLKMPTPIENFPNPNIENPRTILVHADLQEKIRYMKGMKKVDLVVFAPKEGLDYDSDLDDAIGIEIKFNRRVPARKESSNILDDVRKCTDHGYGYVLWLNWDRKMDDDHITIVEKQVEKCDNVKFYYLDVFSNPIKTNVPNLQ
jgi:hypothetical protein